jgi:SAM-dependent methyltransferase
MREATLPRRLGRTPEPTAAMASADSIAGFDEEGTRGLLPIYRFNAMAIHRLAPRSARLVDLGCGSARFLSYLARRRPDLQIVGIDLGEDMLTTGRRHLAMSGLAGRVCLRHGDMREFRGLLSSPADIITSVFAMHHLATRDDLFACLREIAAAVADGRTSLWIFDHIRPRRRRTVDDVPEIFTPAASAAFCQDSRNSLFASWSFAELSAALRETLPVNVRGAASRLLPLYQIHWIAPPQNPGAVQPEWVEDGECPRRARVEASVLTHLFQTSPAVSSGFGSRLF